MWIYTPYTPTHTPPYPSTHTLTHTHTHTHTQFTHCQIGDRSITDGKLVSSHQLVLSRIAIKFETRLSTGVLKSRLSLPLTPMTSVDRLDSCSVPLCLIKRERSNGLRPVNMTVLFALLAGCPSSLGHYLFDRQFENRPRLHLSLSQIRPLLPCSRIRANDRLDLKLTSSHAVTEVTSLYTSHLSSPRPVGKSCFRLHCHMTRGTETNQLCIFDVSS